MNILNLKNNALFLRNWRERMRFPIVASGITITILVIFLILSNCFVHESVEWSYDSNGYNSTKIVIPWLRSALWKISIAQGILLLFFGSLTAFKMASQERQSGTLDFHRSSPSPRLEQAVGLVLGGPVLEWCLFWGSLGVSIYLVAVTPVTFWAALKFYLALIVCGILMHALAVLLAISQNSRRKMGLIGFGLLMAGYLTTMGIYQSTSLSALYHSLWTSAYDEFSFVVKGIPRESLSPYRYYQDQNQMAKSFFGKPIDSLGFQLFIQIPIIGFLLAGISRKISHPERPILSKPQWMSLILFLLFLYMGSVFSAPVLSLAPYKYSYFIKEYLTYFFYLVLMLGIWGALEATPTELLFSKGWRKSKKLHSGKINLNDDHASNGLWLTCFSLTVATAYFVLLYPLKIPFISQVVALTIILSQLAFFAASFEFFNLSRHHHKKSLFWTAIGILWIVIPIFGGILQAGHYGSKTLQYFLIHAPFSTPPLLIEYLGQSAMGLDPITKTNSSVTLDTPFALAINLVLVGIALLLAQMERRRIKEEVLSPEPNQP